MSHFISIFNFTNFAEGIISSRVGVVDFNNQRIGWYDPNSTLGGFAFILGN